MRRICLTYINIASKLSDFGALISCLLLIYATGHILLDILLRVGFSTSTHTMDELVGYAIGATIFWSLAYAQIKGGLIRVTLLPSFVKNNLAKKWLDICCLIIAICTSIFLAYFMTKLTYMSFNTGRRSIGMAQILIWIPQSLMLLGLYTFIIQLIASTLKLIIFNETIAEAKGDI